MKKTISILLIVAMMLASMLAIIPVSAAPKGEKISSAAEFTAMKADGEYYLANDIIITASYAEAFKGKLDGNGKTITAYSATPVFTTIEGAEISNLNIVSEFEAERPDGDFGALAVTAYGTFEDITVDISATFTKDISNTVGGLLGVVNGETEIYGVSTTGLIEQKTISKKEGDGAAAIGIGGIVGNINGAGKVSIEDCVNHVNIDNKITKTSTGGIVGRSGGNTQLTIENSANYGDIAMLSGADGKTPHSGAGGILGVMAANSVPDASLTITDCRNYGDLTAKSSTTYNNDHMLGGIAGRLYGPTKVTVKGCVNSGTITNKSDGWGSAAGIVANVETYNFSWSNNKVADIKISDCVNTGVVSGGSYNGGIMGSACQLNSPDIVIRISDSANYAEIKGSGAGILGRAGVRNGAGKFIITGCYNSGAATAAIVNEIMQQWEGNGVDKSIIGETAVGEEKIYTAEYPVPEITGCVNEGTVTKGIVAYIYSHTYEDKGYPMESKVEITDCVSNGTIAPEGDEYVVTAPEDAEAVTAEVKATVPGNPAALDAILAKYMGLVADDYKAGWDDFEPVYTAALADANKATTQAKLDAHIPLLNAKSAGLELADIDLEPLNAAITAAKAILTDEAKYTPLTWGIFIAALDNAEAVVEESDSLDSDLKPSDVKTATSKLITAQNALEELATAEKAELAEVIEKYSDETKYGTDKYVSTSVDALKAIIAAAQPLVSDVNATKSGVNATIDAIEAAADALVLKADPASLKAKADELSNTYKHDDYTAKSHNDLIMVIRRAKDAAALNDMSQDDIDAVMKQLDDAVKKLVKRGNFDAIDAALAPYGDVFDADVLKELEYNYTIESFKAFSGVITEVSSAKKEDKKPNFSEADAEKLLEKVNAAINGLVAFATYGDLDAKIAELNALDKNAYTAESWQALQDAIAAATALKSNRNTTQPEADAALAAINAAVDALTAVSTDSTVDVQDKKGCGSAIGATVVVMVATLGLGATVVLKKKEN